MMNYCSFSTTRTTFKSWVAIPPIFDCQVGAGRSSKDRGRRRAPVLRSTRFGRRRCGHGRCVCRSFIVIVADSFNGRIRLGSCRISWECINRRDHTNRVNTEEALQKVFIEDVLSIHRSAKYFEGWSLALKVFMKR